MKMKHPYVGSGASAADFEDDHVKLGRLHKMTANTVATAAPPALFST